MFLYIQNSAFKIHNFLCYFRNVDRNSKNLFIVPKDVFPKLVEYRRRKTGKFNSHIILEVNRLLEEVTANCLIILDIFSATEH